MLTTGLVLFPKASYRFFLPSFLKSGWGRFFGVQQPPSVPPGYRGEGRGGICNRTVFLRSMLVDTDGVEQEGGGVLPTDRKDTL